jgi:HK97 family phage major capsid protein
MDKLVKLRQALGTAIDELEGLVGEKEKFEAKERDIAGLQEQITRLERAQQIAAQSARPSAANVGGGDQVGNERTLPAATHEPYFESSFGDSGRQVRRMPDFNHYLARARAQLRSSGLPFLPEGQTQPFRSFGEQLAAVARYYMGGAKDQRLVRAPTGAGEVDPSTGGFLVQTDFSTAVFMRAYEMGEILAASRS